MQAGVKLNPRNMAVVATITTTISECYQNVTRTTWLDRLLTVTASFVDRDDPGARGPGQPPRTIEPAMITPSPKPVKPELFRNGTATLASGFGPRLACAGLPIGSSNFL